MVTIMSGPTGAVLAGTTTVTASAGVAGFQDLVLDTAGSYTLKLQSGTLTPTTTTIQVNAATAAAVNVTTPPAQIPSSSISRSASSPKSRITLETSSPTTPRT